MDITMDAHTYKSPTIGSIMADISPQGGGHIGRQYVRTHPWITFEADLRRDPLRLGMLAGEAISKIEHIAAIPLTPETARSLHLLYLAKGARATTAIEGNQLTEEQALEAVQGTLEVPPSQEYQKVELENIVRACNRIRDEVFGGVAPELTSAVIKEYNRLVLEGLQLEPGVAPGEIPVRDVVVGRYRGAPREDCDFLLDRLCAWLTAEFPMEHENPMFAGILKAILAHLYIAWIHAFGDGNGRTARLMEFRLLIECGVPTPSAHLLSNHYNQTRSAYYQHLEDASRSGGDIVPFLLYALRGFVDQLRSQAEIMNREHSVMAWRDYVREVIEGATAVGDGRERQVALMFALSEEKSPKQRAELVHLDPWLAVQYAGKDRTLTRDLNKLIRLELIERVEGGYHACQHRMSAFQPRRRPKGVAEGPPAIQPNEPSTSDKQLGD